MQDFHAYLLDLDGVVYRGDQVLPGACELVEWLDATGRKVFYLSNNSIATPQQVEAKLLRLGMPRPKGRVLTAGYAAARVLAQRFPGGRIFVLGLPPIEQLIEQAETEIDNLRAAFGWCGQSCFIKCFHRKQTQVARAMTGVASYPFCAACRNHCKSWRT